MGVQVGYTIRFEDLTGPNTILRYMTDGMLLRCADKQFRSTHAHHMLERISSGHVLILVLVVRCLGSFFYYEGGCNTKLRSRIDLLHRLSLMCHICCKSISEIFTESSMQSSHSRRYRSVNVKRTARDCGRLGGRKLYVHIYAHTHLTSPGRSCKEAIIYAWTCTHTHTHCALGLHIGDNLCMHNCTHLHVQLDTHTDTQFFGLWLAQMRTYSYIHILILERLAGRR
jgi:hypothetical protein